MGDPKDNLFSTLQRRSSLLVRPVMKYLVRVKIWSGRTKYTSIIGPPPPQTVLREAYAFRSVKARVTTSETARDMCADENIKIWSKSHYPEGSTSNENRVIRRKAATLGERSQMMSR